MLGYDPQVKALLWALNRIENARPTPLPAPTPVEIDCFSCGAVTTPDKLAHWYIENNGEMQLCPTCRNEECGQ